MAEQKNKWEFYEWTLTELEKKIDEEGFEKYSEKVYETAYNLAELSFEPMKSEIAERISHFKKVQGEALLEANKVLGGFSLVMGVTLETTFSWFQRLLNELIRERALRWKENIRLKSMLGKPLGEQLHELKKEIEELKSLGMEGRVEIPKNIETELQEWFKEREKIKKGLKAIGNI